MDVDAESSKPPTPHEVVWYSDGSVVLATNLYLFKVHKSVLSRHSSVFKDMFESPNIDDSVAPGISLGTAHDTYEGLHLVILAGDEGKDVAHLLRALYEQRYHDRYSDETPLETVVALLVLSTKYDFKDIRNNVAFQLLRRYPLTFDGYCSVDVNYSNLFGTERRHCHVPLLAAAFRANVDVLLPTLYFVSAELSMESILDQSSNVPPECLRTLLLGREKMREAVTTLITVLPGLLVKGVEKNVCRNKGEGPCLETASFVDLTDFVNTCMSWYEGVAIVDKYVDRACDWCNKFLAREIDKLRSGIWDDIPSYFGFPEWTIVRKQIKDVGLDESSFDRLARMALYM